MSQIEHLCVSGRVQGIGFRASACSRARELGLAGWVRNRNDGAVEVVARGNAGALSEFRNWLRKGPPGARIDEVATLEEPVSIDNDSFEIR